MELLIILFLTLLNGFFALSEIALVSVNKNRIEQKAGAGSHNARLVLKLLKNPENFLSSVQVGITLIGIVAGAFGGATLTDDMVGFLSQYFTWEEEYIKTTAMILVIGGITYFTIVLGELVPKTIAMNNPENVAIFCVPIVNVFTKVTYPFVKLLSLSTKLVLKIINVKENEGQKVSEEELRFMLRTAGKEGVLELEESKAMQNLFSFTDQTAKSLMTHSSDLEWVDYNWTKEEILDQLKESVHSRFLVGDGSLDELIGVFNIKDLHQNIYNPDFKIDQIITEPLYIVQNVPAFKILNLFKDKKQYLGVVIDEFGRVRGIITLHDLIEAIVGDLPDEDELEESYIIPRQEGGFLVDGKTPIWELNQFFSDEIIEDKTGTYSTISGFIIDKLKSMPQAGDVVKNRSYSFEILDMDGFRIDKILVSEIDTDKLV